MALQDLSTHCQLGRQVGAAKKEDLSEKSPDHLTKQSVTDQVHHARVSKLKSYFPSIPHCFLEVTGTAVFSACLSQSGPSLVPLTAEIQIYTGMFSPLSTHPSSLKHIMYLLLGHYYLQECYFCYYSQIRPLENSIFKC